MKQLNLGIIAPSSGIYPIMGKDLEHGLRLATQNLDKLNLTLNIIPEYGISNDAKSFEGAINKLASYGEADIIIGICNFKFAASLLNTINQKQVPFILINTGEFTMDESLKSPYVFQNTLALCQTQWAFGKWCQQKFGGNASLALSIYDSGYHLHNAFHEGTLKSGGQQNFLHNLQLTPGVVDSSPLLEQIDSSKPNYVHSILCGVDGRDFLKRYKAQNLDKKYPLTASPFLVEEDLLKDAAPYAEGILSASSWSRSLDTPENLSFVEQYEKSYRKKPNVFSLLGYETGLIINQIEEDTASAPEKIAKFLEKTEVEGPRGKINLNINLEANSYPVYIRKCENIKGELQNTIIDKTESTPWSNPALLSIAGQGVSGWQNIYLGI